MYWRPVKGRAAAAAGLPGSGRGNYRGMLRKTLATACGLVVLSGAAACGTGQRESGASAVAEAFSSAIERGDADAACAALAPETLEAMVASEGEPCEASLTSQELPSGAVGDVAVWGDRAQVRTEGDVLFLVELEEGWKVAAAGCSPQGDLPYRCEVSG
ncbi:hypothetical protein O1R50_21145 [Glycomyces luteolus]|uniref:Uncharacterized protein n=1 Tax=Glycomyces luteolus TaxID=2670330 RepID=A0A9X3PDR1_9ACTN|nr:hypothetical protein [Glycomyces luteolus]MDA1362146.1 hypothetical protein [Glycomyces luteolus]